MAETDPGSSPAAPHLSGLVLRQLIVLRAGGFVSLFLFFIKREYLDYETPNWNVSKLYKRRIFLEELGKALVTPHIQWRQHLPRTPVAVATVRQIQERTAPSTPLCEVATGGKLKRKSCQVCRPSDDVEKCAKLICTKHSVMTCHSCAV